MTVSCHRRASVHAAAPDSGVSTVSYACCCCQPRPVRPAAGRAGSGSRSGSCLRVTTATGWRAATAQPAATRLRPTMATAATAAQGVSRCHAHPPMFSIGMFQYERQVDAQLPCLGLALQPGMLLAAVPQPCSMRLCGSLVQHGRSALLCQHSRFICALRGTTAVCVLHRRLRRAPWRRCGRHICRWRASHVCSVCKVRLHSGGGTARGWLASHSMHWLRLREQSIAAGRL